MGVNSCKRMQTSDIGAKIPLDLYTFRNQGVFSMRGRDLKASHGLQPVIHRLTKIGFVFQSADP